ncbi:MAG: cation diffusion facilitator family transporter, partial [Pseudobdellovibrio sp.]
MGLGHHHNHNHDGHDHHHHHEVPKDFNRAFAIGVFLNFGFVLVEGAFGFISDSVALIADAGHNLSDVASLLIAWGAIYLTSKRPSKKYTYGFKRSSILASLVNAIILLIAVGAISWESIRRLGHPQAIQENTVMIVALIGIFINAGTALLFASGRKSDINIRGAYLHMAGDAAISAGVVLAAFVIKYTSWYWLDPALGIIISLIIALGTWSLLKDSINLALDAVPDSI